jgi:hypothetical protein
LKICGPRRTQADHFCPPSSPPPSRSNICVLKPPLPS